MRTTEIDAALAAVFGRPSETWQPMEPLTHLLRRILGQRTTRAHADLALANLRAHCPTWADVATLPSDVLADLIRPAGLARQKAGCIQGILAQLFETTGAFSLDFLHTMETPEATRFLRTLPGVGAHTAALVLLFGLGRPGVMPVESHIHRVARRIGWTEADASMTKVQQAIEREAPEINLMDLHVNLIQLGHKHCGPGTPDCPDCPVSDCCRSARLQPWW